jgi:hypothetical protein
MQEEEKRQARKKRKSKAEDNKEREEELEEGVASVALASATTCFSSAREEREEGVASRDSNTTEGLVDVGFSLRASALVDEGLVYHLQTQGIPTPLKDLCGSRRKATSFCLY